MVPTATRAEQTARQLADQIDTAAKPSRKAVLCKQTSLSGPPASPLCPAIAPCALPGDQLDTPEGPSTLPAQGAADPWRTPCEWTYGSRPCSLFFRHTSARRCLVCFSETGAGRGQAAYCLSSGKTGRITTTWSYTSPTSMSPMAGVADAVWVELPR